MSSKKAALADLMADNKVTLTTKTVDGKTVAIAVTETVTKADKKDKKAANAEAAPAKK